MRNTFFPPIRSAGHSAAACGAASAAGAQPHHAARAVRGPSRFRGRRQARHRAGCDRVRRRARRRRRPHRPPAQGHLSFGAELDSLADFVGVAPGLILYFWDLREASSRGLDRRHGVLRGLEAPPERDDRRSQPPGVGRQLLHRGAGARRAITVLLPIYIEFLGLPKLAVVAPVTLVYTLVIAFLMAAAIPQEVRRRVPMVLPIFVVAVLRAAGGCPWELTLGTLAYLRRPGSAGCPPRLRAPRTRHSSGARSTRGDALTTARRSRPTTSGRRPTGLRRNASCRAPRKSCGPARPGSDTLILDYDQRQTTPASSSPARAPGRAGFRRSARSRPTTRSSSTTLPDRGGGGSGSPDRGARIWSRSRASPGGSATATCRCRILAAGCGCAATGGLAMLAGIAAKITPLSAVRPDVRATRSRAPSARPRSRPSARPWPPPWSRSRSW